MESISKFSSGYIKTILFAIEYKPKFQFPQTFFIVPHFIHHAQIMGLLLDSSSDKLFDYIVTITHYTLIEAMLPSILKQIFISILFVAQLFLFCYLILATKYTMQVINNLKLRLILERKIEIVNSILHWYFTFYSVFTMPIITISFYYILDSQVIFKVFSYFIVFLQYFQGIILIYLLRNHRFAENNSFKRRFALIQMLNYSLSYGIIFFKYTVDSKILKYLIGLSYAIIQIIDQFYSCPYRDPFREPSLKAALILLTTAIISFIFYSQEIRDQSQFYWTLFAAGLMSGLADSASSQFHEFAMSNYNSKFNLQEKYIIIGVDQFYFHFQRYQENDQTKIVYYQQLIKHRENCTRAKCPTQSINLAKVNTNDRYQLHRMTLSIVSCIFKTCHGRAVIRNGILYKPKFEQLQLQYISFLSQIAQRPLIAYVELRKYQLNQNDDNSLYFRELTSKISQELEFSILYLQERMVSQIFRKEKFLQQEDKLTIAQIWRSINFYQYITPKIIDLIDKKQKYWDLLVEGYEDLLPLQIQQMKLCESINTIYKEIKSKIMIPEEFFDRSKDISITTVLKDLDPEDRNINILNLKIYSLLYSVILNDFDRAFQAEKQIEDLIKEDRQKSNDIIDDGALQKDDAVVVLISLVRKKGHIVNQNLLTLANFFEFQNAQDIAGQTLISTFLPPDLRNLHDSLLNSFISKGFTKFSVQSIHSYYVQKEGYLRECYIKLGNLFQDTEDFVLTGSILKVQQSIDVMMFDSYGKLLGISQEFFETRLRRANPTLTVERLLEQCHIFLIIPYLIINLKKLASNYELDTQEYVDLAYVFENLQELMSEYSQLYQSQVNGEQQKQSTYNLSTIRSNQLSQISNRDSQNSYHQHYQQIKGIPIALLGQERMIGILEFLNKYTTEIEPQVDTFKVKYSIQYRTVETKNEKFAYFILRMEQLNEYERSDTLATQSFTKQLKRTLNTLKFGEQQSNVGSTFSMREGYQSKQQQTKYTNAVEQEQESSQIIDRPPYAQSINNTREMNLSAINNVEISEVKLIQEKVIFQNPIISEQGADEIDFQNLVVELDLQEEESNMKIVEQFDEPKFDSDLVEKKSNSSQQKAMRKKVNVLELFKKNKENKDLHDIQVKQQQSSRPSTAKTSSSKSPYLLVRTLYQIEDRNLNMWMLIILNTLICLVGLALIFVKVFIVQDQYKILQQNLNFVQYPEAINNYFLKTTMYSNNLMQQQIGLANYSIQLNQAILSEFKIISQKIEMDLTGIYEAIISFESQVIPKDDYLKIVNNLVSFNYQFELTILMERLSSNTISLSEEYQQQQDLNQNILSMIIFFRLNMVAVIKIARSYINYLNENLLYYEDQIVNVLTYVIVSELSFLIVLIMIQIRILQQMNDYLRKMLILTTKLSEEDVTLLNRNLQEIKLILKDPRQVLWKTTNYVPLIFEHKEQSKIIKNVQFTYGQVTQSKDKEKKIRRRYQNSSLTSRIYHLKLPQTSNWAILFLIWLFMTAYLLGALGLAIQMISQIKPALTLNLQLIEFKLKYDALVVFAEISKTDLVVQNEWNAFPMKNITFNNLEIISELVNMMDGFQDQMGVIYDQLASSQSLLDNQKTALLIPFKNSLCDSMADQIPSCTKTPVDPSDDNYDYISGGVVNAAQEFSKTLHSYWDIELEGRESNITLDQLRIFLNSKTHKTQFVQHFLYQGKALENIASTMLKFNSLTLETIFTQFQVYMYVGGLSMICVCSVFLFYWVQKIERKLFLSKMALTLIPSEALNEQKTLQELKNIYNF